MKGAVDGSVVKAEKLEVRPTGSHMRKGLLQKWTQVHLGSSYLLKEQLKIVIQQEIEYLTEVRTGGKMQEKTEAQ